MIRPASDARRYRIIVRGECGRLLASLVDNFQLDVSPDSGDTCVVALVGDDPEFWGLMEELRDFSLHIVSVQDLDHGNGQAAAQRVRGSDGREADAGPVVTQLVPQSSRSITAACAILAESGSPGALPHRVPHTYSGGGGCCPVAEGPADGPHARGTCRRSSLIHPGWGEACSTAG